MVARSLTVIDVTLTRDRTRHDGTNHYYHIHQLRRQGAYIHPLPSRLPHQPSLHLHLHIYPHIHIPNHSIFTVLPSHFSLRPILTLLPPIFFPPLPQQAHKPTASLPFPPFLPLSHRYPTISRTGDDGGVIWKVTVWRRSIDFEVVMKGASCFEWNGFGLGHGIKVLFG